MNCPYEQVKARNGCVESAGNNTNELLGQRTLSHVASRPHAELRISG
jgi:hypothetical protein